MTQLEIFRAATAHKPCGRFLYHCGFTPDLDRKVRAKLGLDAKADICARLGLYDPVSVTLPKQDPPPPAPDFSRYFEDVEKPEGSFINGLGVLEIPARFHHFTGYVSPLRNAKTLADLEACSYPPVPPDDGTGMAEQVAAAHAAGKVAVLGIGHMYESAWQIRDYEGFLLDMIERPEWAAYVLDRIAARNLALARLGARAGADVLITGDDVANQNALMFSRPMWRSFMKSRWAKVYAAAREIKPDIQIWYHSDGNIMEIIPELIEIGVTILNPIQPECMDVGTVKKRFGDKVVLDGTIGTQSVMPFGTPADVERTVREMKEIAGRDGALILAPTHVLEPEVPVENIEAFINSSRDS